MGVGELLAGRQRPERSDAFWLLLAMSGVALTAASITTLFLISRAVLDLGGRCAIGGAFEVRVECPAAVGVLVPVAVVGGLAGVALMVVGSLSFPGPHLWPLTWSALFGSQAWNGIEFGLFRSGFRAGPFLLGLGFAVAALLPARALLRDPAERRSLVADPGPRTAPAWATIRRMQVLTAVFLVVGVLAAWLVVDAAIPPSSSL